MNIQNMNLLNGNREQAINIAKLIKDKYDQSKKKTRDYSGLRAYFTNELYVDGGGVRTKDVRVKS
tara:strand:+ start:388 stop:582 length:195 start_codon:yes stop_codon:yes gene_type:complete